MIVVAPVPVLIQQSSKERNWDFVVSNDPSQIEFSLLVICSFNSPNIDNVLKSLSYQSQISVVESQVTVVFERELCAALE